MGVNITFKGCRGGFYRSYLRRTNNLYKPAPTQPITQINRMCEIRPGRVYDVVGFQHRWLVKPAPTAELI
jgi:hypothetical protein